MQRVVNIRYYKILVVADQYYTQLIPAVNQDVIHSKTTKQTHKKEQRQTGCQNLEEQRAINLY